MLYDLVAEYFGVTNDHNLQAAVDASGVSMLDCMDDEGNITLPSEVIPKLVAALNNQTTKMIEAELASGPKFSLEELLFALNAIMPVDTQNRQTRRANKSKNKG